MATHALALALLSQRPARALQIDAYESDTEVADVEAPPFVPVLVEVAPDAAAIAVGRVATEDMIMHCRDQNGDWHRLHPNKLQTACGVPFTNWGSANLRNGRYPENPLAKCECWTRAERAEADERDRLPSPP